MTAIGDGIARLDGPEKVTGHAQYAADFHLEGQAHAVLVGASVPSGRLKTVDTSPAEAVPGLLRVLIRWRFSGPGGAVRRSSPSRRSPPVIFRCRTRSSCITASQWR